MVEEYRTWTVEVFSHIGDYFAQQGFSQCFQLDSPSVMVFRPILGIIFPTCKVTFSSTMFPDNVCMRRFTVMPVWWHIS
jgi:hypothetical protein